jgi:hypothetical protein
MPVINRHCSVSIDLQTAKTVGRSAVVQKHNINRITSDGEMHPGNLAPQPFYCGLCSVMLINQPPVPDYRTKRKYC